MPNHLHVLIDFAASSKSINTIISNGKRFIAYELVKRLQESRNDEMLKKIAQAVIASDKDRGKKHQVFERSFDCKLITTEHFFLEKLNYIHSNPCSGVWSLVKNPVEYPHSSARYYMNGEEGEYPIVD
jgi:REP element-mobilizing transposase RayT